MTHFLLGTPDDLPGTRDVRGDSRAPTPSQFWELAINKKLAVVNIFTDTRRMLKICNFNHFLDSSASGAIFKLTLSLNIVKFWS